jgi:hypothetical protein
MVVGLHLAWPTGVLKRFEISFAKCTADPKLLDGHKCLTTFMPHEGSREESDEDPPVSLPILSSEDEIRRFISLGKVYTPKFRRGWRLIDHVLSVQRVEQPTNFLAKSAT